ncbi:MAG: carbamoyltransferase HypF [Desulfuromonadales bacterium]|nr:carbamoyltransferase HypF [Desulfuromonadales bacterium]
MADVTRKHIRVEGTVQGVGFRPFVYRIATQRNLSGVVFNDSQGVLIEVEGPADAVAMFMESLRNDLPPLAVISRMACSDAQVSGTSGFSIIESRTASGRSAQIAPDCHVCGDCLKELFDPSDRRYLYPFINCTNCGPRYSIVTDIPYDRPLTTMADFPMCEVCETEYRDPLSRRFHAQPNACADCGPQLRFCDERGGATGCGNPLQETVARLKNGQIVAIKGLGGYHLAVDATSNAAVERLRERKHRDEKPFALMAFNLELVRTFARTTALEERMLSGVERPIVLLEKLPGSPIAPLVAPNNRYYGVMLPYTPLHHLLLKQFKALVMTSGNRTDEPIAFEDGDASCRLDGIADGFLAHDRRIHVRIDDSIVREMGGEPVLLRRSRGYVPRSVLLPRNQPAVLALGAELKNVICLSRGERAYLSHHIGDMKNQEVVDSQCQAIDQLQGLFEVQPQIVAHDMHPDYLSTRQAESFAGLKKVPVQHHHAHLASCMAENGVDGTTLGVIFDGTGYGSDGHVWGGEFLLGGYRSFKRVGHLDVLPMPGGDAATKEPWRMAISYLVKTFGAELPEGVLPFGVKPAELKLLKQMIGRQLNSPLTSSCGRLFDAVAALAGIRSRVSYEGQAALELEMALEQDAARSGSYPFTVRCENEVLLIDSRPMIRQLVVDLAKGVNPSQISAQFHNGLAQVIVEVCGLIRAEHGRFPVALSGGVFQNRYLTERTMKLLRARAFEVLVHRQVPPNDGGLALGQAVIAGRQHGH